MVTLGIIAALSSAVYPSYRLYLITSHRHHAELQLMQAAAKLEQHFIRDHSYQGISIRELGLKNDERYHYRVNVPNDFEFQVEAIPMQEASCGVLSINQLGEKKVGGRFDPECWG